MPQGRAAPPRPYGSRRLALQEPAAGGADLYGQRCLHLSTLAAAMVSQPGCRQGRGAVHSRKCGANGAVLTPYFSTHYHAFAEGGRTCPCDVTRACLHPPPTPAPALSSAAAQSAPPPRSSLSAAMNQPKDPCRHETDKSNSSGIKSPDRTLRVFQPNSLALYACRSTDRSACQRHEASTSRSSQPGCSVHTPLPDSQAFSQSPLSQAGALHYKTCWQPKSPKTHSCQTLLSWFSPARVRLQNRSPLSTCLPRFLRHAQVKQCALALVDLIINLLLRHAAQVRRLGRLGHSYHRCTALCMC